MDYCTANAEACKASIANPGCVVYVTARLHTASQSATGVPEVDQNGYMFGDWYDGTAVASYRDGRCMED